MKKHGGFTVVELLLIIGFMAIVATAGFVLYRHDNSKQLPATSSSIDGFPFPAVPANYHLTSQSPPKDTGGLPEKDYVTDDNAAAALDYAKSICAQNDFQSGKPTTGKGSSNGSPYHSDTTLQCYKGNDGWQFDITPAKVKGATTALTIQSIGPPICEGPPVSHCGP